MRKVFQFLAFGFLFILLPQYAFAAQDSQTQTEIQRILQERIDTYKKSVGMVVGLVNDQGRWIISYGKLSEGLSQKPDGNTLYEIGSITKVFTSILLADMVERKELELDDPITKFLPDSVKVPTRNGKEITLLHLATHTSGLPRMPGNFAPKNMNNPFADYTVEQMYEFLSSYTLTRNIGAKYEYSNLGAGLMGHILALQAGMDYETLVLTRICRPLKMSRTRIKLSPELQTHMATGHDQTGNPVMNWDIPSLAGAGALRSTANDMLNFVAANLGLTKSDLLPVMQKTHRIRNSTGVPDLEIGLAWHVLSNYGTEIVWHNGGTGGYRSFIGFDKKKRVGVVVLSNSTNGIDDIGYHLLETRYALTNFEPSTGHTAIKLDPEIYNAYVGQYELTSNFIITITRAGDGLYAQATGQQMFEIFPEAETKFFYKVVDAQIMFVLNKAGDVESLTLFQNGREMPAKKIVSAQ